MGLIDTKIDINIYGRSVSYYRNLGYEIPKTANKNISVNVTDLPKTSQLYIHVECDKCGEIEYVKYSHYYSVYHNKGFYCCKTCKQKHKIIYNREQVPGYVEFRYQVLYRDNYTCQCCNQNNCTLNVHHLNGYNWFIEGRTDIKNGITLCDNCHKNFHLIYGNKNNTKEQFEEWIGYTIKLLDIDNNKLPTTKKVYCIEDDCIYDSASIAAKQYGTHYSKIHDVCTHKMSIIKSNNINGDIVFYNKEALTIKGKHFLWYDEYIKMNKEEINEILNKKGCRGRKGKPVICITTGEVFESITKAESYYNCQNIYQSCIDTNKSSGKLIDGRKLYWRYYDDSKSA